MLVEQCDRAEGTARKNGEAVLPEDGKADLEVQNPITLFVFVVENTIERNVTVLHPCDNDFFEAYKRLERLCTDIYSVRNGINEYLADMESKSPRERAFVSFWDSDYKALKHVRWVRNRIAHDDGTLQISESSDLTFVRDFYDRILSRTDPLALLRKATETEKNRISKKQRIEDTAYQSQQYQQVPERKQKKTVSNVFIAIFGLILLILLILVISRILH